ncbi:MAG: hypothetical protein ACYC91_01755 [Solirubrobacteraceae bacterium]
MIGARGQLQSAGFGDLDAGIWGAVWRAHDASVLVAGAVHSCAFSAVRIQTPEVEASSASRPAGLRLTAPGLDLRLEPLGVESPLGEDSVMLCTFRGRAECAGGEFEIVCPGVAIFARDPRAAKIDSVRQVTAWFPRETEIEAVALRAVRPPGAVGQEGDLVNASVIDGGALQVFEPRLSTTYTCNGEPRRMSLELWLGADADSEQYPRRVAGEAQSHSRELDLPGARLLVCPLRCHARGLDGPGVYLLAQSG